MNASRNILLALGVLALAQTAALAAMVVDRVRLLATGREITLPIVPVDPRDLFRGEYVRLGYSVDTLPVNQLEGPEPARNAPFYVTLEKQPDGTWKSLKITRAMPSDSSPERVVLKARTRYGWLRPPANGSLLVRYGIESYFVPEGRGRELEVLAREKKLAALIAIDRFGNAAIKGLIIDGTLQYEEPLF